MTARPGRGYAAPRFAEVAGLLAESLRDRVIVAHNLSFESRFLRGESGRLGLGVQMDCACGICTMSLASACSLRSRTCMNILRRQ